MSEDGARLWPVVSEWLLRQRQAQAGRAFLWAPVALTCGIWIYFGLESEPGFSITLAVIVFAVAALVFGRHRGAVLLFAMVALGFGLAKARTSWVATPLVAASTGEVQLVGQVEDVAVSGKRLVLVVAPQQVEGIAASDLPQRLRLTSFSKLGKPSIGDHVAAKVRLSPLPSPVFPGGFDYGRQLFFEGIGGTGRITAIASLTPGPATWKLSAAGWLESIRQAINTRIHAVLSGQTAAFAEALIDGERGTIPKELNRSFQLSGLAHVLSISGLHMSLVAGGVFWLVRALLALVPALALRFAIKKWAAAAALAAGLFYMLLAGAEVATQRSYIMIAVVFFAVLVDRPALSLRNLALAALIILATQPEAAIQASFQMSFLAVLGLAAFFEGWAQYRRKADATRRDARSWIERTAWALAAAIATSLATTLVAGAMSSLPAAYHFGRVAPYGLLGNGLAIPIVSLWVMPMALLATLLMPLGLETWPLWLMGQGLDVTIAISDWVAGLPGAGRVVPQPPAGLAIAATFGLAGFCLLRGPLRWAGLCIALMLIGFGWRAEPRDILINRTASNVAIQNADSLLVPMAARKDRFSVEKWLLANGEAATPAEAARRSGWSCADHRCTAHVGDATLLVLAEGGPMPPDCAGAQIVIADFPLRGACRAVPLRIDRFDLWRSGAHAIRLTGKTPVVTTARGQQGQRPWTVVPKPRRFEIKPNSWNPQRGSKSGLPKVR